MTRSIVRHRTVHFYFCVDVSLTNSKILNPIMAPETDGVDVDSSANVYIAGNHIECGDDGVALKSGSDWCGRQWATPTANVTIERNFFNCESSSSLAGFRSLNKKLRHSFRRATCVWE